MSRKEQLIKRIANYAYSVQRYRTAEEAIRVASAVEHGYKLAMKDARKAIALPPCNCRECHSNPKIADRARMFLRPLR
jgi:hypothetical protein